MDTWFVSTVERLPGELHFAFIRAMKEFETEIAAKRYAKDALNRGLRVEAGMLREMQPEVRVRWREAVDWVESEETGSPRPTTEKVSPLDCWLGATSAIWSQTASAEAAGRTGLVSEHRGQ